MLIEIDRYLDLPLKLCSAERPRSATVALPSPPTPEVGTAVHVIVGGVIEMPVGHALLQR